MGDLVATDVTVTLASRERDIGHGAIRKNISIATVKFGDGSKSYPAGGVPMPAIGRFGFQREVKFAIPMPSAMDTYVYKYDATNNKIAMYDAGTSVEDSAEYSGNPAERSVVLLMIGE